MEQTKEYDVTVESGIIAIFQQQSYKLERVFSEFIDNSLQNYLDHEGKLTRMADGQKCEVHIIWKDDYILITDNAFGMTDDEFARALKLKAFNPKASEKNRLSVYGMGLKYAAVYLGNHYSISSTCYGEKVRRFAEIDVPTFEKTNPTKLPAKISDELEEERGTELKITNLRISKTPTKEKDLREKLGLVYQHYIYDGILSISVNKIPVNYEKPKLRKKEEGGSYCENFESSFESGGIKYNFNGWIGILPKGNQSITGLNLVQARRCIQLNWRPEKLFGKGNSFQNSRIVGEVVFDGDHSILSYDKDQFVWADNGAEEAFIKKLSQLPGVHYIISECKTLKKTSNAEEIRNKTFKGKGSVVAKNPDDPKKNPDSTATPSQPTVTNTPSSPAPITPKPSPDDQPDKNEPIDDESKDYQKTEVVVQGKKIPLYVYLFDGFANENWLSLVKYNDGYLLKVNFKNSYITEHFTTQTAIVASNSLAIVLATTMLQSQDAGIKLSDSLVLLNAINKNIVTGDDK